jgi:hypothetical protein
MPFFLNLKVDSPGPVYDVSGSLLLKRFNRKAGAGATFGTGQRFVASARVDGPGPGKYNGRDASFSLAKGLRDGGAATLRSGEARTVLFDNAKRTWGASKHRNGAFFPPDRDYFQRPSPHAACANPTSALKGPTSPGVHAFAKALRATSELPPPMLSRQAAEFGLATSSNRLYQVAGGGAASAAVAPIVCSARGSFGPCSRCCCLFLTREARSQQLLKHKQLISISLSFPPPFSQI